MQPRPSRARGPLPPLTILTALLLALVLSLVDGAPDPSPRTSPGPTGVVATPSPASTVVVRDRDGEEKTIPLTEAEAATVENIADGTTDGPSELDDSLRQDEPSPPAARRAAEALEPAIQKAPLPPSTTLASPSQPGCETAIVRNRSSRGGAPILLFVFHWTGSAFGSGRAIVSWFDQSRSQASSTWILDRGGKCWLTVPVAEKSWTQVDFNPWSVSAENVNPGITTAPFGIYSDRAMFDKAVTLVRWAHRSLGLPYRRGRISCVNGEGRVLQAGFLAHRDLLSCGGAHPDVGGYDYMEVVRTAQALDSRRPITARDRRACRHVAAYRQRRRDGKRRTERGTAHFKRHRRALRGRGLTCANGKPKRLRA